MDEDVKALLGEIVACLRERNEMTRVTSESMKDVRTSSSDRIKEMFGEGSENPLVKMREENKVRLTEMTEKANNDREERQQFQRALLEELRRLNESLESLSMRSGSDGVVL